MDGGTDVERAGSRAAALVEQVFALVDETRAAVLAAAAPRRAAGLRRVDLARLRPLITGHLERYARLLAGTGVVVAPGVLVDAPAWLEWWRRTPGGDVVFLDVDLDPDSDDYYDFTDAPWFTGPERTGERAVVGPYVDHGGTDEYVVTLTAPLVVDGAFLGVVGADLRLRELERVLGPVLAGLAGPAALVNGDGRVMVSTTPRWLAGSLLPATSLRALRISRCAGLPWRVAAAAPA